MQIRFLICIHAREASSMYKPPRARVCKSNLHTRARSFIHSRHAFMQITMSTKDLVPFYDLHLWTFERLGETVQLCNVYWPLEDFDKTDEIVTQLYLIIDEVEVLIVIPILRDSARHNNIVIVLVVLIFSNKYIAIFHYNNTIYCNTPL